MSVSLDISLSRTPVDPEMTGPPHLSHDRICHTTAFVTRISGNVKVVFSDIPCKSSTNHNPSLHWVEHLFIIARSTSPRRLSPVTNRIGVNIPASPEERESVVGEMDLVRFRAQYPRFRSGCETWGLGSTSNYCRPVLLGYGTMAGNQLPHAVLPDESIGTKYSLDAVFARTIPS